MRRARGFGLLEVLVAVALFALAMGLAYGGLDAVVRARAQMQEEALRLAALQRVVGLLERDLRAAVARPVRDGELGRLPALLLDRSGLELSRAGLAVPLAQARAGIERVRWAVEDGALVRRVHAVLDRVGGEQGEEQARLDGVGSLRIEALAADGRWQERWPLPGARPEALPRAVRVRFALDGLGEIERLLELAAEEPR
ncbi:MAG: hypothetical protein KatS3mg126_0228 [Lysobacteraceae bacterium]|nr:MAG: hypothetical protein KatS3mg126_0228 [Xanthomonadaceae bacterium]